jgi:hypothetical protein
MTHKFVVFNRSIAELGVRVGEHRVLAPADAARLEDAGDVTIINHPRFPHPQAKHFAGLPSAIPPPEPERRQGRKSRIE